MLMISPIETVKYMLSLILTAGGLKESFYFYENKSWVYLSHILYVAKYYF
jgi:hypothetical protein